MPDRTDRIVQTTARSLDIINVVEAMNGATMSELREQIDMAESTLYKHLNVLLEHGYLMKRDGQYELGFELFHLGEYVKKTVEPYQLINRTITELREEIPEQVEYGVESNGLLVGYIPSTDYNSSLFYDLTEDPRCDVVDYAGSKAHLHTNAIGKAMLAEMSDRRVREIADRYGLAKQAKNTITSIDALLDELTTIRRNGYATTDEEWDDGLREIGMVVAPYDDAIGGFNAFGPLYQVSDERLYEELPEILADTVESLEAEIRARDKDENTG
ncbi:IclR family transcriptional regulator [Halarchaeum nitratireducens]|uniref:IclR family transcriptional regulator n=1 Tax=Halarchaeum nitratireducens TaxID=489913 RepID=UPI00166BDA71|nr:IclR family transcriptional regulator [Halarchaeum nitratireducens]